MRSSLKYITGNIIISFSLLLIGCGTHDQKQTATSKQEGPKLETVIIQNMAFTPAELYIQAGDTVLWINKDMVTHNITEETTKAWSSSPLAAGQSWKMVVSKNTNYFCSFHPVMKGKITVK